MHCQRGHEKRPKFATVTAFTFASGPGVKTAPKIRLKGLFVEVGGGLWLRRYLERCRPMWYNALYRHDKNALGERNPSFEPA